MKNARAFALVAVALAISACDTKDTTSNNTTFAPTPINEFTGTYSLQGFVADATTGARLGGDLQLFLLQGATVRSASRLATTATDPLLGEYAFAGIPADYNTGNKTFKVVAIRTGYQRFEAEITFDVNVDNAPVELDTIYNKIGNIFMYPIGATTPTYQFTVTYNGRPVPNATVLLDPTETANEPTANTYHALTTAAGGYVASLSATTNASGIATFAGATLSLGAAYRAEVLPVSFTDIGGSVFQLARYQATSNLVAGVSVVEQNIALGDLVPTASNLYVLSASTQVTGSVNAAGALTVVFSAPVVLRNSTGFTATSNSLTAVFGTAPANATLSADGRTLTLTPIFTTAPTEANGVTITYGNGTAFVEAVDYPGIARTVFASAAGQLTFANGATTVDGVVTMKAP